MKRFTVWSVALVILVVAVFNVYGWLVLRRTSQVLTQELNDRLQGLATTLATVLQDKFSAGPLSTTDVAQEDHLIADVMVRNGLFNLVVVNEDLAYLANARQPDQVGQTDPGLDLDAAEILSAFSGITTQSPIYAAGSYYLTTAYAPLVGAQGIVTAVLGVEADARFFALLAGFRNSLLLINGLSLIAIVAIALVSMSLARQALRFEQAAARTNTLALMGQMAGAVAHEIKNPLGIIRGAAERLQRRYDSGSKDEEFTYITEEVDRLNRVITNYLSLGTAGGKGLKPGHPAELANLQEMISDVVASLAHAAQRQGIKMEMALDHLPPVSGNPVELRQVFLNLVLNAVQAQPHGGQIRVSGRPEQKGSRAWAVIEVADQGPGIPAEDHKRLFEPFFTTKEKGSGLGLFVVRRTVEAHQGTVSVRTQPGAGTTIAIRLPAGRNRR